jgi:hypothetical protein
MWSCGHADDCLPIAVRPRTAATGTWGVSAWARIRVRRGVVKHRAFECGDDVRTETVVKTVVNADFNGSDQASKLAKRLFKRVELRGFEPLTPTLPG